MFALLVESVMYYTYAVMVGELAALAAVEAVT
jgi:hypothetical protein